MGSFPPRDLFASSSVLLEKDYLTCIPELFKELRHTLDKVCKGFQKPMGLFFLPVSYL